MTIVIFEVISQFSDITNHHAADFLSRYIEANEESVEDCIQSHDFVG